jgi:hypothetical protein
MKSSIGGDMGKAIAGMKDAFAKYGVTPAAIEKRIGCRLEAIQPAQIIALRKIYASLNDGFSEPKDWFELETPAQAPSQPDTPQTGQEKAAEKVRATPEKPEATKKNTTPPSPPAEQTPAQTAPQSQGTLTHDPHTGEMFGGSQNDNLIQCPKNDKMVDELDCVNKSCRNGCPMFEE